MSLEVPVVAAGLVDRRRRAGVGGAIGRGRRGRPGQLRRARPGRGAGGGPERDRDAGAALSHGRAREGDRRARVGGVAEVDGAEGQLRGVRRVPDLDAVASGASVDEPEGDRRRGAGPAGEDRVCVDGLAEGERDRVAGLGLAGRPARDVRRLDVGGGRRGVVDGDGEAALRPAVAGVVRRGDREGVGPGRQRVARGEL